MVGPECVLWRESRGIKHFPWDRQRLWGFKIIYSTKTRVQEAQNLGKDVLSERHTKLEREVPSSVLSITTKADSEQIA